MFIPTAVVIVAMVLSPVLPNPARPPDTIRAGIADRRRGLFIAVGVFRLKARQDNPGPNSVVLSAATSWRGSI
jgi:hypothetical protein